MNELKRLSLFIVLDAYVTKNAIEEFLVTDWSLFRKQLLEKRNNPTKVDNKMKKYLNYLNEEKTNIELFLNDKENIHWSVLGYDREFFDKSLPKYKRTIKWFCSVDRYPFDHDIFLPSKTNNERITK